MQVEQEHSNLENERAKRLMAMGQMAASLAHEIRNPLGSMELFCSLLKKDLSSQPDSLNLAEQIHSGIKALDRIITNCLQFSRDVKPRYKTIEDTEQAIRDAFQYVQANAEKGNVSLEIDTRGSGSVDFDPYLMNQVLLNLLINAIDAAVERAQSEAGIEPCVTVINDLTNPELWKLVVKDNGAGVAKEHLSQIFDPFFSTKGEGTGLGLTVVHSLISAHCGSIYLESEQGEGTEVKIQIPRHRISVNGSNGRNS